MSIPVLEALRMARLEPGTVRAVVNGYAVELRVSADPALPDPIPEEYLDNAMVEAPWIPDLEPGVRVVAKRGELSLPEPIVIDDADLAPE